MPHKNMVPKNNILCILKHICAKVYNPRKQIMRNDSNNNNNYNNNNNNQKIIEYHFYVFVGVSGCYCVAHQGCESP